MLATYTYERSGYALFVSVGKFGVVHKGKLVADDGGIKIVAIKTIKCKLLSQCKLNNIVNQYIRNFSIYVSYI